MGPAKGEQFNPSKTSMVFRNMGNLLLGDSSSQPRGPQVGGGRTTGQAYNQGTSDSISQFLKQYGGRNESQKSPQIKKLFNDSEAPGKFAATRQGQTLKSSDLHADLNPRVDKSFNLESLINKNEERLKFLDKYRGLESIDEQYERTNDSKGPGQFQMARKEAQNFSPPNQDQQLGTSQDLDHLDQIINKYK